jgi:uncharacterized protein
MPQMKTPGVYIVEKNAFPNSVVEVATAVPAFVGYTERADDRGKPLAMTPWRISSMAEYHQYFGAAPKALFEIKSDATDKEAAFKVGKQNYKVNQNGGRFNLYRGMLQFFQNGGGPCFVVSVGQYGNGGEDVPASAASKVEVAPLEDGIKTLELEQEPTMLVIPDAVLLPDKETCIRLQQAMLKHCGLTMRNRIAILDIYDGDKGLTDKPVDNFRDKLGVDQLDFAAAYYPFVHTSIVQDRDVSFENLGTSADLLAMLKSDLKLDTQPDEKADLKQQKLWSTINEVTRAKNDWIKAYADDQVAAAPATGGPPAAPAAKTPEELNALGDTDEVIKWIDTSKSLLHSSLLAISEAYRNLMSELKYRLNLLPPSPAMAGLYTMVDNTRGVWKAPANVTLAGVVKPAVSISNEQQQDLNITTAGKSINAIRSFIGEGVLVWGARTLAGNSQDWRYINVRRTMIMLEESCRLAAKAMVFEPNVASTWVTIKSMIENFLTGIWKRGGLAGAVPEDAFSVHVGLGETMTAVDILDGILRVTVLVAVSRPAEFIEITFQQQMQKS